MCARKILGLDKKKGNGRFGNLPRYARFVSEENGCRCQGQRKDADSCQGKDAGVLFKHWM